MDPRHYRRGTRRGTWLGGRVAARARVARFPILLKSVQVKSKLYQISPVSLLPSTILWCFRRWKREADRLCFRTKCDPFLWRAVNPASTTFSLENLRILRYYLGFHENFTLLFSYHPWIDRCDTIICLSKYLWLRLVSQGNFTVEKRVLNARSSIVERFLLRHDDF